MRGGNKPGLRTRLPKLISGGILLLGVAGMLYMIKGSLDDAVNPTRNKEQKVSLVKPDQPKPPDIKPPDPKKVIDEKTQIVDVPPDQAPVKPAPPDKALGSTIGPGEDNFKLSQGGDGKRIGGGDGSHARWYAGLLGSHIEQALNRDSKLLDDLKAKRITVRIWVGSSGRVERVEWDKGTVPVNSEQILREQLLALTVQESPDGLNQPIWYRFRPRG